MPAKSAKQEKFMQAVANNPKFAKKVGVPTSVGKEFTKSGGGEMKESKKMVGKEIAFMKKKGAPKSMVNVWGRVLLYLFNYRGDFLFSQNLFPFASQNQLGNNPVV